MTRTKVAVKLRTLNTEELAAVCARNLRRFLSCAIAKSTTAGWPLKPLPVVHTRFPLRNRYAASSVLFYLSIVLTISFLRFLIYQPIIKNVTALSRTDLLHQS